MKLLRLLAATVVLCSLGFSRQPTTLAESLEPSVLLVDKAAMKDFPLTFPLTDEMYQVKNFTRENTSVTASLGATSVDLKHAGVNCPDGDFPKHGSGCTVRAVFSSQRSASRARCGTSRISGPCAWKQSNEQRI